MTHPGNPLSDDLLPADLLPEGLEDRLPREAAVLTRVMRVALGVLDSHGYDRVRPPLVEFERSLAGRMGSVGAQSMFRFVDPQSLRMLALRSDITPQIGRIAATSMAAAPRPLRLAYAGDTAVIRADQLNPSRQRLQLGGELIGSDSTAAAGEIALVAIEALEQVGARDIQIDLTLPDLVDTLAEAALPLAPDRVEAIRRELDTKDAGGLKAAGGEAYLPLLYAAGPFDEAIAKLAAIDAGGALASRIAGLRDIAARIGARAGITLDPSERHGFAYQSWFGFTLYAAGIRGAMGRGGTYAISGSDEVATGFTLYCDRLVDAADGDARANTVFLPLGHDSAAAAALRAAGWRTVAALSGDEDAVQLGCTHTLKGDQPEAL